MHIGIQPRTPFPEERPNELVGHSFVHLALIGNHIDLIDHETLTVVVHLSRLVVVHIGGPAHRTVRVR